MGQIFNVVINWCCSIRGILSFLIIAFAANRIILTSIRDKYGKESTFYRNSKLISGTIFLVIIVNCLCALGKWIFGFGILAQFQSLNPWMVTAILAIIYIAMMASATKHDKSSLMLIATVILAFGLHIIHSNTTVTCIAAGLSTILAFFLGCEVVESSVEPIGITKKGVLLIIAWAASVVAAYMAGEYSLVPKAVEYVQNLLKKRTESATEETPTDGEEDVTEPLTTE